VSPHAPEIAAYVLSCPDREEVRVRTLASLAGSDWDEEPRVVVDETSYERRQERQSETALRLLLHAIDDAPPFVLFLEDDLEFNRHLRHNLERWRPIEEAVDGHFFASLYNPSVLAQRRDPDRASFVAEAGCVYGSQAIILSRAMVRFASVHWYDIPGMQDIKLSRLAAPLCPLLYHSPSLVQHVGVASTWGGPHHRAIDYDAYWRA
jgi:hypothetical protein